MKIRIHEFIMSFIFCLILINVNAQCELDKCNPVLTGMEITPDCIAVGETSNMNLVWAMSALDNQSYCPAYSWRIKISFDAGLRYEYQSVIGPGFDWSYDAANVTITGVNNIPMGLDIPNGVFFQGDIDVTLVGLVSNECVPILSGANIEIIGSDQGGCPQAFSNQTADDVAESALSVSPPTSIAGYVFHDYYADGTVGNNSGTGTGSDDPISGIPVTLKDCGVNEICGDTDDGPSKTTTTIADGTYLFDKLAYGNYQVCFGMNDGTTEYDEFTAMNTSGSNTTDDSDASSGPTGGATSGITLSSVVTDVTDVDAGLFEYATISGTLFEDNDGTSGTTVAASVNDIIIVEYCDNPTACDMISTIEYPVTTDANGDYTITNVIPGVILSINSTNYNTFEESSVVNSQTLDAHSGGSITDQNFALPVTILYFTASKGQDNSLLEWATSQEVNNDYFEVQHSLDGLVFSEIGIVKGNGSVNEITKYNFVHREPSNGINYYRLKQYDFDGRFDYSEVRALKFESVGLLKLNVFPIPTYSNVTLEVSEELSDHKIILLDKLGRLIKTYEFSNKMQIQLSDYSYGVYFIKLIDSDGNTLEQRKLIYVK